jgi:hypothetical protein
MTNTAKFPTPAREKLSARFAADHRRQMVMNPTGGGKNGERGTLRNGAARLGPAWCYDGIAEGIETALAAFQRLGVPALAATT